jgi:hypothetical protein
MSSAGTLDGEIRTLATVGGGGGGGVTTMPPLPSPQARPSQSAHATMADSNQRVVASPIDILNFSDDDQLFSVGRRVAHRVGRAASSNKGRLTRVKAPSRHRG